MKSRVGTIVGFIIIAIMALTVVFLTNLLMKEQDKIAQIQIPVPTAIQKEINQNKADLADNQPIIADQQNWKTYTNQTGGFEFKYLVDISVVDNNGSTVLTHAIPYKHVDPCDFRGSGLMQGQPGTIDKITDFNVSIKLYAKNLKDTVIANESQAAYDTYFKDGKLNLAAGFLDKFSVGSLEGFQISSGAEGCGAYTYYFSLGPNKTLAVKRVYITELNPITVDSEKYLKLPNIIPPSQEADLFKQILSTFKFTK